MQDQIMSLAIAPEVKIIAKSYFGNDSDFMVYQKIKCLRAVRNHNLTCLPESLIESDEIIDAEIELVRLEKDDPIRYTKISALCN